MGISKKLILVVGVVIVLFIAVFHNTIHDLMCGVGLGGPMSSWSFEAMTIGMKVQDMFQDTTKRLDGMTIKSGDFVCDFGTGPGRLLPRVSELVGESGKVVALDITYNAKFHVEKLISEKNLENVEFFWAEDGDSSSIKDEYFDVIFAFDMFHMVTDHIDFFDKIHRMLKKGEKGGIFYLDDGHQTREETLRKVKEFRHWKIIGDSDDGDKLTLKPIHKITYEPKRKK